MGQLRFYAPAPEDLPPHAVDVAYVAGLEAIPWRSHNRLSDHVLTVERSLADSGNLYIPWQISGAGPRVLSTCTLMERDEPYALATELARGTLHRARALVADMQTRGLGAGASAQSLLDEALGQMLSAATQSGTAGYEAASRSIQLAAEAIELLVVRDAIETLRAAVDEKQNLPVMVVGPVGSTVPAEGVDDLYTQAFHAVHLPLRWRQSQPSETTFDWTEADRQIDWSQQRGLRLISGPLLQLDPLSLPEWTYALEDDYEAFEAAATGYVRACVKRFGKHVDIWTCAGRLNVHGAIGFTEEQKLRLAVATLEAIRTEAPTTPIVISFDQPWAEYLAVDDFDLSPLHFADALVRADLGVAGVTLEMNMGYWPGGSLPRDLLAISRHLDRWSLLGIPLLVQLGLPSSAAPDPLAVGPSQVIPRAADQQLVAAVDQQLIARLLPVLLTKPALHGIIWSQWSDADPHEMPHSGLLDAEGHAKPLLDTLAHLRRTYLA